MSITMVYFLPTTSSKQLARTGPNIPPKLISDTTIDASVSVTSRKNSGDNIHGREGDDHPKQFPTPINGRFTVKNHKYMNLFFCNLYV